MLETLEQIQVVLRDFELEETATLLDPAIRDLASKLPKDMLARRERR
jgi:hypothetical protein